MLAADYPVHLICAVLDYARSSYYYQAAAQANEDLRLAIQEMAGQWPTYGYRRVTAQLQRVGSDRQ